MINENLIYLQDTMELWEKRYSWRNKYVTKPLKSINNFNNI